VLEGQDNQLRTFLLETSVLERLSGPLCDAVTGREGSQARLEQAERAGLFLIPLDEVRGWWRYHHLFADQLRSRLQQEQPGRVPELHRNAAAWYEEHAMADDAIGHAVAAGEMLWAAQIIEQHFDLVYNIRGEAATIHRWLSVLPAEVVSSRPRLLLAQALMAATSGHIEDVEPLLDAVECAPADWTDEPFESTAGVAASFLINVPATTTLVRSYLAQLHGDAEATAAFAGIVDPLTSREIEILEMLAAGRSNQAIARELVVTLDTVKKHVGHVLGKLGAVNRTEAVARARELNLIP
jgi:LuxR family transcriptional regulator, maltose regulon positive regulatory protein